MNRPPPWQSITTNQPKKLMRDLDHNMMTGVVAGLADYSGMPIALLRVVTVIAFFMMPPVTILLYIVMSFTLPAKPSDALHKSRYFREKLDEIEYQVGFIEQRVTYMESYVATDDFSIRRRVQDLHDDSSQD